MKKQKDTVTSKVFTLPDANVVAERLCIEAEKLGLCHPTEIMIANCLHDFEWNALMYPNEAWEHHGGNPGIKKEWVKTKIDKELKKRV